MLLILASFSRSKFYIREMATAVSKACKGMDITLSENLREELKFWRFLDTWSTPIPWRQEGHVALRISTDASAFRWAAKIHLVTGEKEIGDYWTEDLRQNHINVKEMYAVLLTIRSLPLSVKDCRVDINVDNQVALNAWHGRGPKSFKQSNVARLLFQEVTKRNLQVEMSYVPSDANQADYFSRTLSRSDAMLSPVAWSKVQAAFGGDAGHNLDLMSLDSNVQRDFTGAPLRHFTPFPTPLSGGVNVFAQDLSACDGVVTNAYVYPPFSLIGPLLRLIRSSRAVVTIVAPKFSPLPVWWPMINAMAVEKQLLALKGSTDSVLFPSKKGYHYQALQNELWVFRVAPC